MKILFMGTPDIASGCLQELIDKKYDIIGVVTQPDKQVGRGKKIVFSPVKQVAIENNLPVYQPVKAKEESFVNEIKELNPDVIVVVAYGQILSKEFLEIPKQGCINVHVSLLPKYRGAAPINWVIINGEEKTGVSTMFMDEGLDTGDVILQSEFALDDEITDELVVKFGLEAEAIEDLLQQIQDAGISIVDKEGNPSPLALQAEEEEKLDDEILQKIIKKGLPNISGEEFVVDDETESNLKRVMIEDEEYSDILEKGAEKVINWKN